MFSSGFIPSEIDGTEVVYTPQEWKDFKLPAEYSFLKYMPPVIDQGRAPVCVLASLSSWINWKINSNIKGGEEIDGKEATLDNIGKPVGKATKRTIEQ